MTDYFEQQYKVLDESLSKRGLAKFGLMSSFTWNNDPKRLLFVMSRYKFAARMLEGTNNVLEVGCGDGFCARIVKQHVANLLITDADPHMIANAQSLQSPDYPVSVLCHDFCEDKLSAYPEFFDGVYLLDVLEHIPLRSESVFFKNLSECLLPNAKVIIGMPSTESQVYASPASIEGHVNCKTKEELKDTLESYFSSVFCFSMNDEVVHTGYNRMSNYLFATCTF